ncbi:MAG: glycerol dehydratase small subunit [Thermomicrobiales bacterium]|nr:glycerol dehydratase small subunit [Thermomicrobiales bacterium]
MPFGDERFDPHTDYPIADRRPDLIRTATGKGLESITLVAVAAGEIGADDLKITAESLERQALVAEASGRPALVPNFRRAAELTRVPDQRLLAIYEALRPGRSTPEELARIADELTNTYRAPLTASLVREAAAAYTRRGLTSEVRGG